MQLTTVMYHYVRPLKGSDYPRIKGLELSGFRAQLDYLSEHYQFIGADHLIAHLKDKESLPENACLLTFDDGYRDHFDFVLPELVQRRIKGCFFPPACSVVENKLLDVNAIHFILAATKDISVLVQDLKGHCLALGMTENHWQEMWGKVAKSDRFDSKDVIFFKRMLQRDLDEEWRSVIVPDLFEKHVGQSQSQFSKHLYMSAADLIEMQSEGMYIGNHTYNHVWLNTLTRLEQETEITKSLDFLSSLGAPVKDWIMCYPYGGYNADTIEVIKANNCIAGLTTTVGVTDLAQNCAFEIDRFDTNDFPQE